ncbi:hypothetical protein MJ576_11405 [Klebsiella pneumoniae]|nr:hypothetical protein MJ576_11405 [Klebsiella pneumoniae]
MISAASGADNDILALEPEALEKADTDGLDAALPSSRRARALNPLRKMAVAPADGPRMAEQKGKSDLALYLLRELDDAADQSPSRGGSTLLFEIKSRRLRPTAHEATRSE